MKSEIGFDQLAQMIEDKVLENLHENLTAGKTGWVEHVHENFDAHDRAIECESKMAATADLRQHAIDRLKAIVKYAEEGKIELPDGQTYTYGICDIAADTIRFGMFLKAETQTSFAVEETGIEKVKEMLQC